MVSLKGAQIILTRENILKVDGKFIFDVVFHLSLPQNDFIYTWED